MANLTTSVRERVTNMYTCNITIEGTFVLYKDLLVSQFGSITFESLPNGECVEQSAAVVKSSGQLVKGSQVKVHYTEK